MISNNRKPNPSQAHGADIQFPIVGIGASAGGLEAFETFFQALPEDTGIAFVLVSHLDPTHASMLPDLIQKKTQMIVSQVTDNMHVTPNQVFIIPPNKEMSILNGKLHLLEMRRPRGVHLPIDTFLRSLAQDQGSRAIGIIFSGTGTDGTLGVRTIKGEAGMVMVQDPDSAKYDGMPKSAIATGVVDYILAPENMPDQLLKYVRHQVGTETTVPGFEDPALQNDLQKIFILLRTVTGHDFSLYKKNTIWRRIERRMHVHQIDNVADYIRYLQESSREVTTLFKELLIGVTSFFRDPQAYELLEEKYLPELFKDKPDDYQVRIWVPGCSSGEEAYSVAIAVQECLEAMGRNFSVQIFATDLDEDAINTARNGVYPESISADVTPARLKKFFIKTENYYQIKKNIREMVVFATQNITKDPPFTKLDLLCCRNLLIYFGRELQKKLLPKFHYSLKPGGILFLGSSETLSQAGNFFTLRDRKWKIFQRSDSESSTASSIIDFPATLRHVAGMKDETVPEVIKPLKDVNIVKLLKTILAQTDMPTSVVIDDLANIIYIHGRTGRYLEPAEGETTINIIEMARPGLKAGLISAIRKMSAERREAIIPNLQVQDNGDYVDINLIVKPLPDFQTGHRGMMLVIFDEITSRKGMKKPKISQSAQKTRRDEVKKLEEELFFTRENLQTTIEDLETANEELKSTNEELQSTNEELETSKEELQSLNEESSTVNAELQSRIEELLATNDDIKNLLDATDIATLFLDIDLNIRRFTVKMTDIFPLTPIDLGRPIKHFKSNLKDFDLHSHAEKVLNDLEKQEIEVLDTSGVVYRTRLRPFRTINNVIDGVVITFEDITQLKQLLSKAKRLAAIVRDSNDAIILQDLDGNILSWNNGATGIYGYPEKEALRMNIGNIFVPDKQDELKALIVKLQEEKNVEPVVTERKNKNGKFFPVLLTVSLLPDETGGPPLIVTTERNLHSLKKSFLDQLREMDGE